MVQESVSHVRPNHTKGDTMSTKKTEKTEQEIIVSSINNILAKVKRATIQQSVKAVVALPESFFKVVSKEKAEELRKAKGKAVIESNLKALLEEYLISNGDEDAKAKADAETRLVEIAKSINSQVHSIQASTMLVGELLVEACDNIKAQGKKQGDFLAWAKDNCSIGKAQAYKLMACFKAYGKDSDFADVSMRVLYSLTSETQDVLDRARVLAKKGQLDSKALARIQADCRPATESSNLPNTGGKVVESGSTSNENKASDGQTTAGNDQNAESTSKDGKGQKAETVSNGAGDRSEVDELQNTISSLNMTIDGLNQQIKELQAINKKDAVKAIPGLLQFDSALPSIVLGIEPKQAKDKEAINKAYRSLAKIWTAATNKEASEKIKNARALLLADLAK